MTETTTSPSRSKPSMTQGPVGRALFTRMLPMFGGIMGMVVFNLVDTFFIGQLGTKQLAAFSFTFPVIMLIAGLTLGLGTGVAAVVSRAMGQDDKPQARRLTTDSLVLALSVVFMFVSVGFFTIDPLFRVMGATDELLPLIKDYMQIWYPGMVFLVIPMVGNSAIRATGDMKTPGLIMIFSMTINLSLDPLLIFGIGPFPRMEIQGAAIATVIARSSSFMLALWILTYREKLISFKPPGLTEFLASSKKVLYIGLPSAASNLIIPLGMGVIVRLVASYGAPAVAGFGVAGRIEMFVITIFMALASVLGPFIGQNWGAGRMDRVRQAVGLCYRFSFAWGAMVAVLLAVAGPFIAPLFDDNPQTIEAIVLYLWIVPIAYGFQGVLMTSGVSLNVLHKPLLAAVLSICYIFVLYVPLAFLGSWMFGLEGIFAAGTLAKLATGSLGFLVLRHVLKGF